MVDGKRFLACSNDVIDSFFIKFATIIRETDDLLRFTADETMMETLKATKVVVPEEIKRYVESKPPELPHITAMCCNNIIGTKPPLFLIIQKKKTIPIELKPLCDTGKIWLISTPHGWMDRWAFLLWAFCFHIFFKNLKDIMPTNYLVKQGLLVCDGHSSRENPLALQLLHSSKIRVLILPPHTTHVLQLFDVGLASILKKRFTALFIDMLKKKEAYIEGNMTASMRKIGVEAFVRAWDDVCNKDNCSAAAQRVGLNPVSSEAPKESPYVRDPTEQERALLNERRNRMRNCLIINNCELTTEEKIAEIRTFVQKSEKDKDLCKDISEFGSIQEIFNFIKEKAASHGVHMLTAPPPFRGTRFDLRN